MTRFQKWGPVAFWLLIVAAGGFLLMFCYAAEKDGITTWFVTPQFASQYGWWISGSLLVIGAPMTMHSALKGDGP